MSHPKISQKLLLLTISLFSFTSVVAQDAIDVLRYSYINPTATARGVSIGNALGSVGGDFGTLSINPAGIGIYRSSEFMFTPSLKINNVNSTYLNQINEEPSSRFNFNNIGVVFARTPRGKRYDNSKWKSVSFAFGLNRLADFNRSYSYSALNTSTSFSEIFANDANDYPGAADNDPTSLAYLGYQSFLVDQDSLGYYSLAYEATDQLRQKRSVKEKGGMNEIVFSFGGNYMEKLMLGATISLPSINYTRESYFEEVDASGNTNNYFQAFRYSEALQTSGLGFNLKLGAIYKAADAFRLGVAVHTPTWLALSDIYDQSLTANTENFKREFFPSDPNPITTIDADQIIFDYTIRTPWRGILSATGILGRHGFITADYEYVDYRSARLGFSDNYTAQENQRNADIKRLYKGTSNLRIGIEGRLQNFFLRGGFGMYGSPFANNVSGMNRMNISGGFGYRNDRVFADIGFMHTRLDEYEVPYFIPGPTTAPTAKLENRLNNVAITLGFKF